MNQIFRCKLLPFALSLALCHVADADVLEPYDGIPGEPGSGALTLFPAYWRYPIYADRALGDIRVDGSIAGAALKGGYFFPKLGGRFSWGAIFSIPFLESAADGAATVTGFGDPGLGIAFWPYEDTERNLYLSIWWVSYFPLGDYDERNPDTSPGMDALTHVPAFEVGWYPGRFLFDGLLQYWHFDESDKLRVDNEDYVELDLVLSWSVTEKFVPSLHANAKWETEDQTIGGSRITGTRGHVYSLGPKLSYLPRDDVMVSLTWQHDLDAQNRLRGDWVYLRIAWAFGPR
jgi:hypothetical protein